MDEKISDTVNNICTVLGGALLLYPLIDKAAKTIIPEMKKLESGETLREFKLLPSSQKEQEAPEDKDGHEHEGKWKSHADEVSELKRKLAEYESKSNEHKGEIDS